MALLHPTGTLIAVIISKQQALIKTMQKQEESLKFTKKFILSNCIQSNLNYLDSLGPHEIVWIIEGLDYPKDEYQ